jgi:hypothetical protein
MVKLNSWDELNKSIFRRHLPQVISARELTAFRLMEGVFSGKDQHGEVHQCGTCGNLFFLSVDIKDSVPKDWLRNPVCPICSKLPDYYKDKEWRRKFEAFHKITNTIQRFEESEPNQRNICLKEVRECTKGFFDFATVSEMFVGYYKMMDDLGAGDISPSLKPEWKALIDTLFESAKNNISEFLKFVFSPDSLKIRQILATVWEAKNAVVRMEKDYFLAKVSDYPVLIGSINMEEIEKSRIRFSLLIYNHMTELDSLYDLTMNLIRLSRAQTFVDKPFSAGTKYPAQRIQLIKREKPELGAIFDEFWVSQVRNAFSHSKYRIEDGYFVKTDENFRIQIAKLESKINVCSDYYNYLEHRIAKEEALALEKKVFHMSNGDTITISSGKIPENL